MSNDSNLINRCKKGDRQAQQIIYEKYSSVMLAICIRYVKDRMLAEDIMQEGFMTIFAKVGQFKDKGSFEGWMKRIMINSSLKSLQISSKNNHFDIDEMNDVSLSNLQADEYEVDINYTDPKSVIENTNFSQDEILKVVSELPDGFRVVFNMYAIENYKHKEIAEILGISISTSKTQLIRARKNLQDKLFKLGLKKQKDINNNEYSKVLN